MWYFSLEKPIPNLRGKGFTQGIGGDKCAIHLDTNSEIFGLESSETVFSRTFIAKILVNLSRFSIFLKYRKFRKLFPGGDPCGKKIRKFRFGINSNGTVIFGLFDSKILGNHSKLTIFSEMSELPGIFCSI